MNEKAVREVKAVYQFEYASRQTIKASVSSTSLSSNMLKKRFNIALLAKLPTNGFEDSATLTARVGVYEVGSKDFQAKIGF